MNPRIKRIVWKGDDAVILVPGAYGVWNAPLMEIATESLQKAGASTIQYESERDYSVTDTARTSEEWKSAFRGKTFERELSDLLSVFDYTIDELRARQIMLAGYSYGGALVIKAAALRRVDAVLLASPQIFYPPDAPMDDIYDGFPSPQEFRKAISKCSGLIRILQELPNYPELRHLCHAVRNDLKLLFLETNHQFRGKEAELAKAHVMTYEDMLNHRMIYIS